jgi:hypothetical protein
MAITTQCIDTCATRYDPGRVPVFGNHVFIPAVYKSEETDPL